MLACRGPTYDEVFGIPETPDLCEALDVEGEYGGVLRPSEDLWVVCHEFFSEATVVGPALAVNDAGILLSGEGAWEAPNLWIADGEVSFVETGEQVWIRLAATADEKLHLLGIPFSSFEQEMAYFGFSGERPSIDESVSFAGLFGPVNVMAHGDTLHVWGISNDGVRKAHLTLADGVWNEEPAPSFAEGLNWQWGIDGSGHQLGYTLIGDVDKPEHIWAHDGVDAWSLGEANMADGPLRPIPPAVPIRADDPHLLAIHGAEGIAVIRPQAGGGDRIAIPGTLPAEPQTDCDGGTTYDCQADTICTTRWKGAAVNSFDVVRSADGRLWVAWVEQDLTQVASDYGGDWCEAQTIETTGVEIVHLAEISLADGSIVAELTLEQLRPRGVLLASHGDRLTLAISEEEEEWRWRILSFDLG